MNDIFNDMDRVLAKFGICDNKNKITMKGNENGL